MEAVCACLINEQTKHLLKFKRFSVFIRTYCAIVSRTFADNKSRKVRKENRKCFQFNLFNQLVVHMILRKPTFDHSKTTVFNSAIKVAQKTILYYSQIQRQLQRGYDIPQTIPRFCVYR